MISRLPKTYLFILLFLFSTNSWSLDFHPGLYELIKGDAELCFEGPLQLNGEDLILGAKLIFKNYKSPIVKLVSDDKDCSYTIKNIHTKESYQQQILAKCKKSPSFKRTINFHLQESDKLKMSIVKKDSTTTCELSLKK